MTRVQDPTDPIAKKAMTLPEVTKGTACNQSSFKVGRGSFLFLGPGAKGQGYRAMFKLDSSIPQAKKLAAKEPERFGVGSNGWVSVRFTAEAPLPRSIWEKWLKESYDLTWGAGVKGRKKVAKKKAAKKTAKKKVAKKKTTS